ncbi:MAG TPA: hypothetical protein VFX30_01305 [bacterium]|nr:hypothetical protein [bacterium]
MMTSSPAGASFVAVQAYISSMAGQGSLFTPGGKSPLFSACAVTRQNYNVERTRNNLATFTEILQSHATRIEGPFARKAQEEVGQLAALIGKMEHVPDIANTSLTLEEFLYPRVGLALIALRAPNPDDRVKIYFTFDHAAIASRFARETFPES